MADNLYLLANSETDDQAAWTGGNTAVWITDDGVVLVDTKLAGYGQAILERVREVTDKPVTTIINTHTHFDHAGSNTEFPDTVSFVAHENTATQMARAECGPVTGCDAFKGENRKYLPDRTYADRLSLFSGRDRVDLYHFGRGHTNGDTLVVFPAVRTMHTGDLFPWRGLPFVDVEGSGGSAVDYGATLNKAVAGISGVETVIAGHIDTPVAWSDFEEFADFYNHLADAAREGLVRGPQRRGYRRRLHAARPLPRLRRRAGDRAQHHAAHPRRPLAAEAQVQRELLARLLRPPSCSSRAPARMLYSP